ncbi:MAG: sugar phosphate isomerase/epimerase [Ruminococcaceae bacterium]|nr:sugar phosphate isomerase/epimerase [Oscillospiraceae bacterium]
MKLATTTGDFNAYTDSQTESLKLIKNAGFKYADYSFGYDYKTKSGIYSSDFKSYVEKVKEESEKLGIKLVQAHSPLGKPFLEGGEEFLLDTISCVEACGEWGIKNLVVHSGYAKDLSVKETFERNKEFYTPILAKAEEYGINILVENFNKMSHDDVYWIDNAPDLLAIIEYIDHPLFHAVWDVGHANMQEMPQDEALRMLGNHIYALHIHDNMGDRDSHMFPYLGTANLDAVMNGLKEINYNGYFTFEVGAIFKAPKFRRTYESDTRLFEPPLSLKISFENSLFEVGKHILTSYDCYEE